MFYPLVSLSEETKDHIMHDSSTGLLVQMLCKQQLTLETVIQGLYRAIPPLEQVESSPVSHRRYVFYPLVSLSEEAKDHIISDL